MAAGPVRSSGGGGAPSHTRRGAVVFYALMYCLMSSTMLVVNKAAMAAFPHPNTVLLAQLASSAALAWLAGALGRSEVDALEASKVIGTLPMTAAFFSVLLTSMHALHHVNVDTMVVLRTSTPITVAVGEWLFLNTALPSPRTWASLSAVVLLTAAAFSLHVAVISVQGLLWLASWFASCTFYMVYSAHYVKAVKLTTMGRVYYENLLSCVLCLPGALADLPRLLAGSGGGGGGAASVVVAATSLIGLSCLMGFSMNWFGWALRQHITALSYTVLGVLNKLLTVFINAGVWDKHGPPMSQALLVAGILAGTAYQQQAAAPAPKAGPQQLPHFRGKRRPLGMLASMLAATGAIAVLIWLGASMGRFLDRTVGSGGHDAPLVVDAAYIAQLKAAAQAPISVALMTSLPWSVDASKTAGCTLHGVPLDCRFDAQPTQDAVDAADALYYHLPTLPPVTQPDAKARPNQLRVAMSLEPGDLVPRLNDPAFMCRFDAEMSYRSCAQVVNHIGLEQLDDLFTPPAVAFAHKQHAAAYIQDRCSDSSHRSELVRALIELGDAAKVPVHSMGQCQNNQPWPGSLARPQVLARYKFCLTLERTTSLDYVSSQLWEALAAGCIPVYMGSPDVRERLPDPRAAIVYDPAGGGDAATPAELDALMQRVGSSSEEFAARQAWRAKQPGELAQGFGRLWELRGVTGECLLCRFLAAHRVRPRMRYTTCLFNATWMGTAGRQVHRVKCGDAQQQRR